MTVTFTGDTSITGIFVEKLKNNEEIFSDNILMQLQNSNFVICNLEGPVTEKKPDESSKVKINSPANTINYLSLRNIKVFNLANNHILDCGTQGLNDTLSTIQYNNCKYFGAGRNFSDASQACILEHENVKIALFGISDTSETSKSDSFQVFLSNKITKLRKQIKNIAELVDYVIVNFHGGEEYTNFPSPVKRRFLKKISRINGIDIVIAHHSHTLQSFEKYKGKYIFYSLGNFIFDIPLHDLYDYTKESALLKFTISKNKFSFEFIPFRIGKGKISDADFSKFKKYFNKISDFSEYKKNWQAEAYRVLFLNNRVQNSSITMSGTGNSLQKKTLLQLFFSKKFYKKAIKVLLSNNYRSLYINAIIHKIYLKTKNISRK